MTTRTPVSAKRNPKNIKKEKKREWTVYIVRCADGSFYTGYTGDVEQRLAAHNGGKGAKYTASRRPVELVYREIIADRFEAMKREYRIKCMTRAKKSELIDNQPREDIPSTSKKTRRSLL